MSRFNTYFNNDFRGCTLLAYAYDKCRNRQVRIFMMPGYLEDVGISDGVDKWVCPVAANAFSVDVRKLIGNILAGIPNPKPVPPGDPGRRRRQLVLDEPTQTPAKPRRAVLALPSKPSRIRRALLPGI